jgi:hypothetical protein
LLPRPVCARASVNGCLQKRFPCRHLFSMRSDAERLQDVLKAIERIEKHAARGKDAFYKDELLQTWERLHISGGYVEVRDDT